MKLLSSLFLFLFISSFGSAQEIPTIKDQGDKEAIRAIYDEALVNGESYENLRHLCKKIGHRLSGSPQADQAVIWGEKTIKELGVTVSKQEIKVPHWVRGDIEKASLTVNGKTKPLHIIALGGSIGTQGKPITGEIIEVKSIDELKTIPVEKVKDKIVFFNRPMDPKLINTFKSYGGCVSQRTEGASEAAVMGAKAVMVRSMSLSHDDHPHTGSVYYTETMGKIPAVAISTNASESLTKTLKNNTVKATLQLSCELLPDKPSHNVFGEIKGSIHPEKIIVIGGHLDSWDIGEGAHDDGAGIVQSIEVLRLLKAVGYKPKHTIRCVLFMNEENGNNGGETYAKVMNEKKEEHIAAIESDRGGFTPRGFSIDASEEVIKKIADWQELLEPYGLHIFEQGYGGVDIGPIKKYEKTVPLIGLVPDSQRYFDYHHSENDVFEMVNKRELELGGASIAALVYLIDKYGL